MNSNGKTPIFTENPNQMFIYFSALMEKRIVDKNDEPVGNFYDIIVVPTEVYPQSSRLIIRTGFLTRRYASAAWSDVAAIEKKQIVLNIEKSSLVFTAKKNNKEELALRRDILDQQVVDTHNHKVIRVNDIHLLTVGHSLMLAHVDISLRGLFRRLGWEKGVDFLVGVIKKNAAYLKTESLISWKFIHPLSINPVSMTIKIDAPQKQFSNIPAADLGEVFLDLNIQHQIALFKSLDIGTRAKIFINIDFKTQKSLVEELPPKEIIEILNNIPSDEATDFLEKLPKDMVDQYLMRMENKQSKKLSQLLGYSSDSAGGLMTTEYLSFSKDTRIENALQQIREKSFKTEPAQFVYVTDEQNHFIGCTNFRRLILANPQDPIQKTIFPKTHCAHLDSTIKEVAYLMEKYKYYVIPVVDNSNVLQGIITVDDILSQVISIAWRKFTRTNK